VKCKKMTQSYRGGAEKQRRKVYRFPLKWKGPCGLTISGVHLTYVEKRKGINDFND